MLSSWRSVPHVFSSCVSLRGPHLQAIQLQLQGPNTHIPHIPILLSELSPAKLALFDPYISTFVQTSCPRLSIDWGYAFGRPLLSPYELTVALGTLRGWMNESDSIASDDDKDYPMNFYEFGTPWAISRKTGVFPVINGIGLKQ